MTVCGDWLKFFGEHGRLALESVPRNVKGTADPLENSSSAANTHPANGPRLAVGFALGWRMPTWPTSCGCVVSSPLGSALGPGGWHTRASTPQIHLKTLWEHHHRCQTLVALGPRRAPLLRALTAPQLCQGPDLEDPSAPTHPVPPTSASMPRLGQNTKSKPFTSCPGSCRLVPCTHCVGHWGTVREGMAGLDRLGARGTCWSHCQGTRALVLGNRACVCVPPASIDHCLKSCQLPKARPLACQHPGAMANINVVFCGRVALGETCVGAHTPEFPLENTTTAAKPWLWRWASAERGRAPLPVAFVAPAPKGGWTSQT